MRTKLILVAVAVAVVATTYLAGYWPQRTLRIEAEAQASTLQGQLDAAVARVRTGELLGQALTVKETTMRQNYGQASDLSSRLFDAVRVEAGATPDAGLRAALTDVMARRDAVTAALAKGDPGVVAVLNGVEVRLREALGYAMPADLPAVP